MKISEAPHGINVVVETGGSVIIGRFDKQDGSHALLHHCDVHPLEPNEDAESYVRRTAKYGVAVNHQDYLLETASILNVRLLSEIEPE
jgi:hypothetical protein